MKPILTPKELGDYLGLHLVTVYRLIKDNKIPAARVGGQWRFKTSEIDRWLEERMTTKGKWERTS